jgi:hypothetical protein
MSVFGGIKENNIKFLSFPLIYSWLQVSLDNVDTSTTRVKKILVSHLPPLQLQVTYHSDYPTYPFLIQKKKLNIN